MCTYTHAQCVTHTINVCDAFLKKYFRAASSRATAPIAGSWGASYVTKNRKKKQKAEEKKSDNTHTHTHWQECVVAIVSDFYGHI